LNQMLVLRRRRRRLVVVVVVVGMFVFGQRGFLVRMVGKAGRRRWLRVGLVGRRRVWGCCLLMRLSRRGFAEPGGRVGRRRIVRSRRRDSRVVA